MGRECEERENRKERVAWRGRRIEGERERDTQALELLLMLLPLLLLLQPLDNSPPRESREEGRRSEGGGRRRKRHLSQDVPVLASTHGKYPSFIPLSSLLLL